MQVLSLSMIKYRRTCLPIKWRTQSTAVYLQPRDRLSQDDTSRKLISLIGQMATSPRLLSK